MVKILLDGKVYDATFNDNPTANDILKMFPLDLTLQRFAGHEYYCVLPQKPSVKDVTTTSEAHAGGIYYFEGWNAFTIVFGDANVAPYKVVHLGDVQSNIVSQLTFADNLVDIKIELNHG